MQRRGPSQGHGLAKEAGGASGGGRVHCLKGLSEQLWEQLVQPTLCLLALYPEEGAPAPRGQFFQFSLEHAE